MPPVMPQEIDVWYVLPAIRKELAKTFIKQHELSQKEVAKILGITEATVSHYTHAKRGSELKFTPKDIELIKNKAKVILEDRKNVMKHMYELCEKIRGAKCVCELHRKHDKSVPHDCKLCTRG